MCGVYAVGVNLRTFAAYLQLSTVANGMMHVALDSHACSLGHGYVVVICVRPCQCGHAVVGESWVSVTIVPCFRLSKMYDLSNVVEI